MQAINNVNFDNNYYIKKITSNPYNTNSYIYVDAIDGVVTIKNNK
jgi:hypothetical protein